MLSSCNLHGAGGGLKFAVDDKGIVSAEPDENGNGVPVHPLRRESRPLD